MSLLNKLWRKKRGSAWRVGVMQGDRETALAIVGLSSGQRPILRHCTVHPAFEIKAEHVLLPLIRSREYGESAVSAVLGTDDYELVQLEAPEVQPAEMRSAVRWKLKDVINFPINDAVVDVFGIPEQVRYVETRMVFAVAARRAAVERAVRLFKSRMPGFDVVDIPELCMRNVSALLPQDEEGVALLALNESSAQLVLTCQGILYLSRRIDLGRRADNEGPGGSAAVPGSAATPNVQGLALEIQRSLDYYESHFDRTPITNVVLVSGDERADKLVEPLRAESGMSVEVLDVAELVDVADDVEPDMHWPGLLAFGAALRRAGSS